jgi:hypothetical protein
MRCPDDEHPPSPLPSKERGEGKGERYEKKNKLFLYQDHGMTKTKRVSIFWFPLFQTLLVFLFLIISQRPVASQPKAINWDRMAQMRPDLKVLVLVRGERPISLDDLALLADFGMIPADRDPGLVLGLRQAVFSARLKNWMTKSMPADLHGRLLERFTMTGVYRLGFKVEKEGYQGPLSFEMTTPRDGFGKRLLYSENLVRPYAPTTMRFDSVGNRWFSANYSQTLYGETIRLHFAFKYAIDMASLLKHDLMLLDQSGGSLIPEEVRPFLNSGYKIDKNLPEAVQWASEGVSGPPLNVRSEYQRLTKFIKDTIVYDQLKRNQYFGGRTIYSNLDDMYQEIAMTLSRRLGACPDTSLLECAFLRARGIPCRIAGRFGHFYTDVYISGMGWMSTSVNPTGIPLIIAPGPDHIPYQMWKPTIPLRTTLIETKVRIEPEEGL